MEKKRRFSLLALPQFFDGSKLGLNIVVLPRNQNPLRPAIEADPDGIPDAPAFAAAKLKFAAKIIIGFGSFPNSLAAADTQPLVTVSPPSASDLFTALGKQFSISNLNQDNKRLDLNTDNTGLNPPRAQELTVRKYLPVSYRNSFNFTSPRTKNARTDDSYHCAIRAADRKPGFKRSPDDISWGKVFGYALRQPLLARQLGMVYATQVTINAAHFPHGGWLYVDLGEGSDYINQQKKEDSFIKRYAARIPTLKPGSARPVFATMLFPVLYKANKSDPDPVPDGNFDEVQIETAAYDDGFAKIVHAWQPVSSNPLAEESDGAHPAKDVGIRLGWDDEQILIWYMRQMAIDPTVTNPAEKRLDVPLGLFGYAIDVRTVAPVPKKWESLTAVHSKAALAVPRNKTAHPQFIELGKFEGELPFQVYPAQLDGDPNKSYWLPMYFANWNGHSMVLPDQDAADIYQTTNPQLKPDPERPNTSGTDVTGTGVSGPAQNQLNKVFQPEATSTTLQYGNSYELRVRYRDLSGGGTNNDPNVKPVNESVSGVALCHFKRHVAPNQVRITDMPVNSDNVSSPDSLKVRRPLLGYPAVVYTAKYAKPVAALKQAALDMAAVTPPQPGRVTDAFGIEDPDVDRVEITVEVQTLKMDNLLSVDGKDNYVVLYKTRRSFPAVHSEADYKSELQIPIVYKNCKVLHVGAELNLKADLKLADDIDKLTEIVLPTARTIRLSVRGICEEKPTNQDYYGLLNDSDAAFDTRYGHTLQLRLYKPSTDETGLFVNASAPEMLRGIYLQPDPPPVLDGSVVTFLIGKEVQQEPDIMQRLAKQLGLESVGLTLTGAKGEHVQFGCSSRIRHSLAPDRSSLTFSSKGDLINHWLCCLTFQLDRDWTWDGLQDRSFVVSRSVRFTKDDVATETEKSEAGAIELRRTTSFDALQDPKRDYTRLVFIDAVEPKNERTQKPPHQNELRFPDTISVSYTVATQFKAGHGTQHDSDEKIDVKLPITTPPAQVAKIASAGLALSPYRRNETYSATEPRERYLWIEFEEPVKDPQDCYFARVLAYAPDQLISNNHPDLLEAPQEPSLPIDPEYVRVIPPGASNDLAGLNAMQPMEKASDSDRHYLLPLPPGLHAEAPEIFGFFTYEFRVGHYRDPQSNEMVWSTAQGRFGRPLRATGIQHPAPTLTCSVHRDEEKLYVSAPYAVAVMNGKNVTADPPRTELWCLLYAQVRQADNKDSRNILLDDKQLDWRIQIEPDQQINWFATYDPKQRTLLKNLTIRNSKDDLAYAKTQHIFKLVDMEQANKDATRFGTAAWSKSEVQQLLRLYGLPLNSPLSVLVVEVLPFIRNIAEHVSPIAKTEVAASVERHFGAAMPSSAVVQQRMAALSELSVAERPSPVSDELGHHRILRTSPLTEVPFVC